MRKYNWKICEIETYKEEVRRFSGKTDLIILVKLDFAVGR